MPRKSGKKYPKIKPKLFWLVTAVILLIGLSLFLSKNKPGVQRNTPKQMSQSVEFDFGNKTTSLNHEELSFYNGLHKSSNQSYGMHTANIVDRTVDQSKTRAAAILVDSPGGSGTFYYLIGGMLLGEQEVYSKPVLLGDRIKIVSVEVITPGAHDNGEIRVRYLDRPEGAPMAAEPTIEVSSKFAFEENGNLINVLH